MSSKVPKPLIVSMLTALGTGLVTLFVLKNRSSATGKPSKKAPQLSLNNPGSQDEFLQAPSPSEIG